MFEEGGRGGGRTKIVVRLDEARFPSRPGSPVPDPVDCAVTGLLKNGTLDP